MTRPVILLASTCWWHSVPRLALALTNAGCIVSAIYPMRGHPIEKVPAVAKRFVYRHKDPVQALSDAITATNPDMVLPCDDRAILHLQQLHARERAVPSSGLLQIIERSLGQPSGFSVARTRYPLISLAKAAGIAAPATAELRTPEDLDLWLLQHGFPTVLKVDGSWGGNGVFVVQSVAEAHLVFNRLSRPCPLWIALKRRIVNRDPFWVPEARRRLAGAVSAQTYIEGSPGNCAMFSWQGQVLAGIAVEVMQTRNATAPATIVKVVERPEMMHAARELAAQLNLSGFFGLDFMIDRKTNVAQLIEMNARPTPLCHLRLGHGRDMIGALVATLTGQAVEPIRMTTADVIAYFPDAARINAEEIPADAYHDVPVDAPELVAELQRRPWPNRSILARIFDWSVGRATAIAIGFRRQSTWPCKRSSVTNLLSRGAGTSTVAHLKLDERAVP